jgi:hypothetical protein
VHKSRTCGHLQFQNPLDLLDELGHFDHFIMTTTHLPTTEAKLLTLPGLAHLGSLPMMPILVGVVTVLSLPAVKYLYRWLIGYRTGPLCKQ